MCDLSSHHPCAVVCDPCYLYQYTPPFFFVYCGAYGQVAISLVLWYNYHTVKAEFIFWRMLFEEEQHLRDCIVNERFANTSRNPLVS